ILRSAHQLYEDGKEFHNLSLYVRHNHAKRGNLRVRDPAIDIDLLNMNGEYVPLLSHCNPNRPLLILAGSYTWPPFRGLVPQLNRLMDSYRDRVDMITVYIEEAHAVDEWPIGGRIRYVQPKCDADRIQIANDFIKAIEYRISLLIDPVSKLNPFSEVYCPWPIRFYVIDHMKKLSYIAEPIEGSFPLELIRNALDDAIQQ
ncbi:unnamed protein product, partial [Rotaria magnacalcarata]